MAAPSLQSIPHFIHASTAAGLKRSMLKNNTKFGLHIKYFDIQYVGNLKRWYAWFVIDIDSSFQKEYLDNVDPVIKE